jgi:hypothetical protein
LVERLLSFAIDGNVADPVALQAINSALDRAGMKPGVDLEVTLKPFEAVFEQMDYGGKRSDYRGEPEVIEPIEDDLPDLLQIESDDDLVIDVEVVDTITPDEPDRGLDGNSGPFAKTPAPDALMTMDAATSAAKLHRAQRALPRGR